MDQKNDQGGNTAAEALDLAATRAGLDTYAATKEQATPGPWETTGAVLVIATGQTPARVVCEGSEPEPGRYAEHHGPTAFSDNLKEACANVAFIVAARNTPVEQWCRTLLAEVEQERVRLAGCLCAAEGYIDPSVIEGVYGWSPAYQKTRELRESWDRVRGLCWEAVKQCPACGGSGTKTVARDVSAARLENKACDWCKDLLAALGAAQ